MEFTNPYPPGGPAKAAVPDLLPRSGIGVRVPHLVIAPPGNPTISLDARLLDRVELVGRSSTTPMVTAGASAGVATAAALSLIPGGIVAYYFFGNRVTTGGV